MKRVIYFFALLAATIGALYGVRLVDMHFDGRQIASVVIFSMFIYGTLLFGEFRLAFAFGGIALLLASNLLTVSQFTESANLRVIIFLVGMFLVIGFLEENRFFEQIVEWMIRMIGPRPRWLLLALMAMGTISAALVDEVTSILFMTGTMLHLTRKYELRLAPFIIMLVFATNIGSAASSIGNPIGVMIAFNAGFSFVEFLRWSAPVALAVNVVTYLICSWWYRQEVSQFAAAVLAEHQAKFDRAARRRAALAGATTAATDAATAGGGSPGGQWEDQADVEPEHEHSSSDDVDPAQRRLCWLVFILTLLLLITHDTTERILGKLMHAPGGRLPEGTMMVGAALIMGSLVLLLKRDQARQLVERRVDWWTLSFFMMLFASVGTLEHTQVTKVIASRLLHATGGNTTAVIQIVGWATGWLSAFLDNVLAVATFMPVIHDIRVAAAPAAYPASIYWMMLFGGTFMGNMTVIGSTANIIAIGVLEKRGHGTIKFGEWFKIGFIVSIASMAVASVLLYAQAQWIPVMAPP